MYITYRNNNNELFINTEFGEKDLSLTHSLNSNYIDVFRSSFMNKDGKLSKNRKQQFYVCNKIKDYIQNKIGTEYSYAELFAGIGIKAGIFCNQDNDNILLNDLDINCSKVLRNNFKYSIVTHSDAFNYEFKNKYDINLVDFNNYTFKKYLVNGYNKVLDNIFRNTNKFVILNDCSIFRLKKGTKAIEGYSKLLKSDFNTIYEYRNKIKEFYEINYPEFKLVCIYCCTSTDYLLFERTNKLTELVIDESARNEENLVEPIILIKESKGIFE